MWVDAVLLEMLVESVEFGLARGDPRGGLACQKVLDGFDLGATGTSPGVTLEGACRGGVGGKPVKVKLLNHCALRHRQAV